MSNELKISYHANTNVGRERERNEDTYTVFSPQNIKHNHVQWSSEDNVPGLFAIVADGMGGAEAGDVASSTAVEIVKARLSAVQIWPGEPEMLMGLIKEIILYAHYTILEKANALHVQNMGTTIVLLLLVGEEAYIAWCGDSRAYRYNKDGIPHKKAYDSERMQLLSKDHSFVWRLVERGDISAEDARLHPDSNVILHSLGDKRQEPHIDISRFKVRTGDRFLLCTDGINGMLSDSEIESVLAADNSPSLTCFNLIRDANDAGGYDNMAAVLVDIIQAPLTVAEDDDMSDKQNATTQRFEIRERRQSKLVLPLALIASAVAIGLSGYFILSEIPTEISQNESTTSSESNPPDTLTQYDSEQVALTDEVSRKEREVVSSIKEKQRTVPRPEVPKPSQQIVQPVRTTDKKKLRKRSKHFLDLKHIVVKQVDSLIEQDPNSKKLKRYKEQLTELAAEFETIDHEQSINSERSLEDERNKINLCEKELEQIKASILAYEKRRGRQWQNSVDRPTQAPTTAIDKDVKVTDTPASPGTSSASKNDTEVQTDAKPDTVNSTPLGTGKGTDPSSPETTGKGKKVIDDN